MTGAQVFEWGSQRWGWLATLAALLGVIGGTPVANVMATDRFERIEARAQSIERRLDQIEAKNRILDALALSTCLAERNAIARQALDCGVREQQAGVITRTPP